MNIQAEASLYPLGTIEIGEAIDCFTEKLTEAGLDVCKGDMSTTMTGEAADVFAALGKAFTGVARENAVVLVLKLSNACPM